MYLLWGKSTRTTTVTWLWVYISYLPDCSHNGEKTDGRSVETSATKDKQYLSSSLIKISAIRYFLEMFRKLLVLRLMCQTHTSSFNCSERKWINEWMLTLKDPGLAAVPEGRESSYRWTWQPAVAHTHTVIDTNAHTRTFSLRVWIQVRHTCPHTRALQPGSSILWKTRDDILVCMKTIFIFRGEEVITQQIAAMKVKGGLCRIRL